ncbi:MAG: extracellular solute-binding protein [Kiritimatiellae bacterium]|nr:extracellular solute-binding protein [Kiritimatiellia bacterium]
MTRGIAIVLALLVAGGVPRAPAEWSNGVWRAHALALHGEPKYPRDFRHFEYVRPDAPKGGTLRLAEEGGFDSLNPFIARGSAPLGMTLVFETLAVNSGDEPFTIYGLLADTIEMPSNRAWVAFHLRPEARWHDGVPVTAADVLYSFEVLREKGAPTYRLYYRNVERAEALDARTVRFYLATNHPNRELPLIVGHLPVLPAHWWTNRDFAAVTLEPPLGSGPYRVAALEANRFILFERVTNYWGASVPVVRGMYNFDRVRYEVYRDATVSLEAFKAGAYDWRVEMSAKDWAHGYRTPEREAGVLRCELFPSGRIASMQGFALNLRRPLFADRRTRRALQLAFDFEWANRALFHGQYRRCRSYFGESELEARGRPEGEELRLLQRLRERYPAAVPEEVFLEEYQPPRTEADGGEIAHRLSVRSNLLEARRELLAAGWRPRPDDGRLVHAQLRDAGGRPLEFSFEILLVQPAFERVVLPFTINLRRLGIEARVRTVDMSIYMNRILAFDFDVIVANWPMSESPGNEQRDYWHSLAANQPGSRNVLGLANPAVDELVEELIRAEDRPSLVARVRALDRLLQWGYYCIPNWYLPWHRIAFWDRFGYPPPHPAVGTHWIYWWFDAEKDASLAARREAARRSRRAR